MAGTHIATSPPPGQARGVTAADIPQELFRNILRNVIELDVDDTLPNPKLRGQLNPSLVCVYWAQEILRSVYDRRKMRIETEKQAKAFRKLVVHRGSERLIPIVEMIDHIDVQHNTEFRSWHHILLCLIPAIPPHKFRQLQIKSSGEPANVSFSASLCSPHWRVPKRLPSFSTSYRRLELVSLRFSSLHALTAFLRQFPHLEELSLMYLTWEDNNMNAPVRVLPSTAAHHSRPLLSKIQLSGCSDSTLLLLYLAQSRLYGLSLLKNLPGEDQGAITGMLNGVREAAVLQRTDVGVSIDYTTTPLSGK